MRIAIFTNNYLPNPFGVSMSIESFRKELERQGHTVFVFAPEFKNYKDENLNVFRYPSIDLTFKNIHFPIVIPFSFEMNKNLNDLEIDIIHAQHPNLLGWEAKRWAKKKNIPLVFTWHTLYDQYTHFVPFFIPKKLATWWTIKNAVNYADAADCVITPTKSVAAIIRKWGVKNQNLISIPTGVDEKLFATADRQELRSKYVLGDKKVISIVSRFTKEKNIEFLFDALMPFLKQRSEIIFLVKARGDLEMGLKERTEKEGLEKQIIFCDENDKKEDVFAAGDLFVYASKSETQGIILAEAFYMGLPIVAVDATGACDIVENGKNGFLVKEDAEEFVNAVEKILDNDELRKNMSENAKQEALANWTDKICAQKLLAAYGQAIENKRKIK